MISWGNHFQLSISNQNNNHPSKNNLRSKPAPRKAIPKGGHFQTIKQLNMASNSETGHAKNVSNFLTTINACTGFGATYQPFEDRLKLPALNTQYTACAAAQSAVKDPLAEYNRIVSERQELFGMVDGLTTRTINMFLLTQALPNVKKSVQTIAKKIRGSNSKPKSDTPPPPGETPEDTAHSTSQRSFVMRADNFETFISFLSAEPTYSPAETDLQVASLETVLTQMRSLTDDVDVAYQALRTVRTNRNKLLYARGGGLIDTALDIKKYLKAAFGARSANYKQISGLKFVRIAKDPAE